MCEQRLVLMPGRTHYVGVEELRTVGLRWALDQPIACLLPYHFVPPYRPVSFAGPFSRNGVPPSVHPIPGRRFAGRHHNVALRSGFSLQEGTGDMMTCAWALLGHFPLALCLLCFLQALTRNPSKC